MNDSVAISSSSFVPEWQLNHLRRGLITFQVLSYLLHPFANLRESDIKKVADVLPILRLNYKTEIICKSLRCQRSWNFQLQHFVVHDVSQEGFKYCDLRYSSSNAIFFRSILLIMCACVCIYMCGVGIVNLLHTEGNRVKFILTNCLRSSQRCNFL